MGDYVASQLLLEMKNKSIEIKNSKILIMGLTFKENCADVRNSGVKNIIYSLKKLNCVIDLYDPWANIEEIKKIYNIKPVSFLEKNSYDAIIIAVAHNIFGEMGIETIYGFCKKNYIIYDLKYLFTSSKINLRL